MLLHKDKESAADDHIDQAMPKAKAFESLEKNILDQNPIR